VEQEIAILATATQTSAARARPENADLCSPAIKHAQARNSAFAVLLLVFAATQPTIVVLGTATMGPATRHLARVAVV
jgi:hypothetical protein